ncbi:Retrovirus-related Pol polyprotein from transposon TNT 1-94 [Gossypium australe]|uniref:Retrovirus-related Pol polyprotein from transposon TNT 1-94 n=1 Tax=Gossypium australe TaxID=47621 RepID=A0A5B6WNJ6_9ROSI|nr:Retrovirus-related Pol polyprotein from transposon TNT 1-94 [Gossypium australe]
MVDGLIYSTQTRLDIAFLVRIYARAFKASSWGATKRVLLYGAETIDFGLWYEKVPDFKLGGDLTSCLEDRRNTSGYIFNLKSTTIFWSLNKLQ